MPVSAVRALAALKRHRHARPGAASRRPTRQGHQPGRRPRSASTRCRPRASTARASRSARSRTPTTRPTTDHLGDPLKIHAAQDVKSGDLPGPGNPAQPPAGRGDRGRPSRASATDEGRAMLQIAHDVAPGSEAVLRDGLRRPARASPTTSASSPTRTGACGADVSSTTSATSTSRCSPTADLTDAIDDVAAKGVHYFSSAGNEGQQQAWDSPVRLVPAKPGRQGHQPQPQRASTPRCTTAASRT